MVPCFVHYNEPTMTIFITYDRIKEGATHLGSVDRMPDNPKLVVHFMLKRANLPTSGWSIEDLRI